MAFHRNNMYLFEVSNKCNNLSTFLTLNTKWANACVPQQCQKRMQLNAFHLGDTSWFCLECTFELNICISIDECELAKNTCIGGYISCHYCIQSFAYAMLEEKKTFIGKNKWKEENFLYFRYWKKTNCTEKLFSQASIHGSSFGLSNNLSLLFLDEWKKIVR